MYDALEWVAPLLQHCQAEERSEASYVQRHKREPSLRPYSVCTLQVVACCSSRVLQPDLRRVRSRSSVRLHAEPGTKEASTESAVPAEEQGDDMDLVSHSLAHDTCLFYL